MFILGPIVLLGFVSRFLWRYKLGMRQTFKDMEEASVNFYIGMPFLVGILYLVLVGPFVLLMMSVWYGYLLVCILYNMCGRP